MCVIKHSYTEIFIAAFRDIIMPKHELAIASNIYNIIRCLYTSNVKLHELDVYGHNITLVMYLPICKSFHTLIS